MLRIDLLFFDFNIFLYLYNEAKLFVKAKTYNNYSLKQRERERLENYFFFRFGFFKFNIFGFGGFKFNFHFVYVYCVLLTERKEYPSLLRIKNTFKIHSKILQKKITKKTAKTKTLISKNSIIIKTKKDPSLDVYACVCCNFITNFYH